MNLWPQARGIWLLLLLSFSYLHGTTVVPPEFPELVNESEYIIRGVVKSLVAEHRSSANGVRIVTLVEVEVVEVIAGSPPAKVVLQQLGGSIGGEEMIFEGAPQFIVGEEQVLFVRANGRAISPITRLKYGQYRVVKPTGKGQEYVTRANGIPLKAIEEVSLAMTASEAPWNRALAATPEQGLTVENFIQQIRAARESKEVEAKK